VIPLVEVKELIESNQDITIESEAHDLIELGLIDSMESMELLTDLEKKYSIKFDFVDYTKPDFFTLNSIVGAINSKLKKC
tara:strand:- start:224 stop:463 length:240 start_codon:yes stop_codon:yes gene_type:complete